MTPPLHDPIPGPGPAGAVARPPGDADGSVPEVRVDDQVLLDGIRALTGTVEGAHAMLGELADRALAQQSAGRVAAVSAEQWLVAEARLTRTEARTLLRAVEVLRDMPATSLLWRRGVLTWAQVRGMTGVARRLDAGARGGLDRDIAARADDLAVMSADEGLEALCDAAQRLADDRDRQRRRERRAVERRFAWLQGRLDGSGVLYSELDAPAFTVVAEALHAAARTQPADPAAAEQRSTDAGTMGRRLADGLVDLAQRWLGGTAGPADARPRATLVVDLPGPPTEATRPAAPDARLLWPVPGPTPRLAAGAQRELLCDAVVDVVGMRGTEVATITSATRVVPPRLRSALVARDGKCRFPACDRPAAWTDAHHVRHWQDGGPTRIDNLILLCRAHHTAVHRGGWRVTLVDGAGVARFRKGRRIDLTTLPRARRRIDGNRAPPVASSG